MARTARLLLLGMLLAEMLPASPGYAQTVDDPAAAEPEFLKALPRPPDRPASLLAPAPPLRPPPNLEQPYFQLDPLLDPPALGQVGWFADVDIGILKPHLVNELSLPVTFPTGTTAGTPGIPPGFAPIVQTGPGQNFISPPIAPSPPSRSMSGSTPRA